MSAARNDHRSLRNVLSFWKAWLRRPGRIGAVAPSSRGLATAMACGIGPYHGGVVVELGGGTGSITTALLRTGLAPDKLVVIEREPSLAKVLARRFPGVRVICGDAGDLTLLLRGAGIDQVGAVVSGLPLIMLPPEVCRTIVAQAFALMPEDGVFVQFTYGPVSPLSRATQRALGLDGDRIDWVLGNLPPAAVWRYRRRRQPHATPPQTGERAA
jgi:phosphatidylethanolamine/phosphatidyl-N-methylethanolamine N-methyltransferase